MNARRPEDLSQLSMLELFRLEAENQTAQLTTGLLELERGGARAEAFQVLMRAAHSLKGAARIVNLDGAVRLTHALEDCFVAAQQGRLHLGAVQMDLLLRGADLLAQLARRSEADLTAWETEQQPALTSLLQSLKELSGKDPRPESGETASSGFPGQRLVQPSLGFDTETAIALPAEPGLPDKAAQGLALREPEPAERILRLTAENLNRLLALAGESLVESRWLHPFADSLQQIKRQQTEIEQQFERLRVRLKSEALPETTRVEMLELGARLGEAQRLLAERVQELDVYGRRSAHLSQRLYQEVLRTRMRPFSDGVRRFPRMVRDVARSLGKEVCLEILGETTQVDRDILERLETPLAHLLRNAVDHGCETPTARQRAGKSIECSLRLEARHSAGVLLLTVVDDGTGVDLEQVRRAVIQKGLVAAPMVARLTESELLEFLFRPGFSLKDTVTEISGRGFGLDVVQNMVKSVRGAIRINNQPGRGLRVQLQLPLTLSVLRTLLVEIAGEAYAFPLTQIIRALRVPQVEVGMLEDRLFFQHGDQRTALLSARQLFGCEQPYCSADDLAVVMLGDRGLRYGLIVDRFLGERELVVQPLDSRLGKIQDISAAALMEDGAPVLIVDVEDMVHSIEKMLVEKQLPANEVREPSRRRKRILAVDDSLTVREMERKLLNERGYLTDVAVDGQAAWEALRTKEYDLLITDVDMPRLSGVELAALIKQDARLRSMRVMVVSCKENAAETVSSGLAEADCYLAKANFHDQSLVQAVIRLIGEPDSAPPGAPTGAGDCA